MGRRKFALAMPIILLGMAAPRIAFAHAILVRATPADHSMVHSHSFEIVLEYNSRIEAARSMVMLTNSAGTKIPVKLEKSSAAQTLKAAAGNLANGVYLLHWQVLASDGHISRGDLEFTVDAK